MKISIITVVKNARFTIENTLQSILTQSYKDIELIVIDGASNDGTIDIINKYQNKIAYFISEADTGVYNAMNKGIKAATGDILYFLNANDSLYKDNVLQQVADCFRADSTLSFLYGNIAYINDKKDRLSINKYDQFNSIYTFLDRNICHQAIFYKADLFKKYGLYNENYKIFADYEYNVKLLVQNKIKTKYIDITIANYEIGGMSFQQKEISDGEFKKIYNKYFKNNKVHKIDRFLMKFFGSPYKLLKKFVNNCGMSNYFFKLFNISIRKI